MKGQTLPTQPFHHPKQLVCREDMLHASRHPGWLFHPRLLVLPSGRHFVLYGRGNIGVVEQELLQRCLRCVEACAWRETQGCWKPRGRAPEAQLQCQSLCFGPTFCAHATGGEHGCRPEEFVQKSEQSTQEHQRMACPVGHSSLSQTSLSNFAKLERSQDLRCGSQAQLRCCGRQLPRFYTRNTAALKPEQHTDPRHNELSSILLVNIQLTRKNEDNKRQKCAARIICQALCAASGKSLLFLFLRTRVRRWRTLGRRASSWAPLLHRASGLNSKSRERQHFIFIVCNPVPCL